MSEFDARQYWDKRLKQVWNLQGVGMRGLSRNYNRWLYRVRRAVFRRTVRGLPYPLNECDVLDVGSGTGFYINLWRRLGARRVTGVDIADSAVQQLSEKYPDVRFQQADIGAEKPFDNESFDIVSAFDILFHIVDDQKYEAAISNTHAMLRPGGMFVFTENFVHGGRRASMKHFVNRNVDDIERMLDEAGFQLVRRRPAFALMLGPVDSPRPARRKMWMKVVQPLSKNKYSGNVVGAVLYPIERLLTRILPESDTTEIMVCRKRYADEPSSRTSARAKRVPKRVREANR